MRPSSKAFLDRRRSDVERELDRLLPPASSDPAEIHRAMRYSLFAGGKRIRPLLTLAAGEAFDADDHVLLPVACAMEMIHTYSLVHDDLPAMDDDDLRRGRPTCHKVFGEAIAILTGDALLTLAFESLAAVPLTPEEAPRMVHIIREIAAAAGTREGMVGGQVLDMLSQGTKVTPEELEQIHRWKTGALIRASILTGAMAGRSQPEEMDHLNRYAINLGLVFQIVDDVLDVTSTTERLGKTAGKDQSVAKATYPSIVGIDESRRIVTRLVEDALKSLSRLDRSTGVLVDLAEYLASRRA
ncbi:MAG: polyprenyl synthetase family protein [Acidobacteria bacterium]|nr:polyprenyl synthetase family protein [Acidobacteriota bacterium]